MPAGASGKKRGRGGAIVDAYPLPIGWNALSVISDQDTLDTALVRGSNIGWEPVRPQRVFGDLHDDVVRIELDVILVTSETLQAGRARSEYLDRSCAP